VKKCVHQLFSKWQTFNFVFSSLNKHETYFCQIGPTGKHNKTKREIMIRICDADKMPKNDKAEKLPEKIQIGGCCRKCGNFLSKLERENLLPFSRENFVLCIYRFT
jgi:hypothetical protein